MKPVTGIYSSDDLTITFRGLQEDGPEPFAEISGAHIVKIEIFGHEVSQHLIPAEARAEMLGKADDIDWN